MNSPARPAWPYPHWVAHRGAGTLAPENTLAAIRLGARHGFRMFECDVTLSADGELFLLHDPTLERTTNGHGEVAQTRSSDLRQLDAGRWHSEAYAGERIPTLRETFALCSELGLMVNLEIKPSPGLEADTGRRVAEAVTRQWPGATLGLAAPLVTSFSRAALQAARSVSADLRLGLLLDRWADDAEAAANALECVVLVANHTEWTAERVAQCHARGLRAMAYTVNDADTAQRLMDWGLDGVITDRVDALGP